MFVTCQQEVQRVRGERCRVSRLVNLSAAMFRGWKRVYGFVLLVVGTDSVEGTRQTSQSQLLLSVLLCWTAISSAVTYVNLTDIAHRSEHVSSSIGRATYILLNAWRGGRKNTIVGIT